MALGRRLCNRHFQTTHLHSHQKNKINKEGLSGEIAQEPTNLRSTYAQLTLNFRPSTVQVQKIIMSMNEGYMAMREIMENMGLSHRTSFRENYFRPALEDEAVELLYPDQPNHPKQKYRLTEAAREWKKNHSTS